MMTRAVPRIAFACLLVSLLVSRAGIASASDGIPSPEKVFGHTVGADRKLVPFPEVLAYLETVDAASDRVSIEGAGTSTLGNPMPLVVLTSPANQARLERFRQIARRLALPHDLSAEQARDLTAEGKVIALVTCTIHSTEVGCTQMAMEFVHQFATTEDPRHLAWMDDAILLLMPSINPDGQIMVLEWYEEWLDTKYEGGRMPWLYHHYVGHDNNRDFYMLTQKETRVVNDVLYHRWFPQVYLDEHQMGSSGPRMFVPPQTDPLAPEVHSLVFRQSDLLGTNMSRRLEEAGKRGVGHNMIYDSYWPGGTRNTAWWKNVTGLLTEVASARIASPVHIDPGELRGGYKGLPEYTRRANYPSPWGGGGWRLRDIVEYELVATWAFLEACAENRVDILRNMHVMAREAIERGTKEPPYAFILPPEQHDPVAAGRMVEILLRHGLEVQRAIEPIRVGYAVYPAGTTVIPASQPYRPLLLTLLRAQRYPEVRPYVDGPIFPPYDVTSWSLPISMGVEIVEAGEVVRGELASLTEPAWPAARLDAEAAGYVIPHSADSAFTGMNRLLKDGATLYWLSRETDSAARGDIYLSADEVSTEKLSALAAELHLPVSSVPAAPGGEHWRVAPARVGLYKPWVRSMDEGWTRWLLERYEFSFTSLSNEEIRSGAFIEEIDVLLVPDVDPSIIAKGKPSEDDEDWLRYWRPLPPRYVGGLDEWPDDGEDGSDRKRLRARGRKEKRVEPTGGRRIAEWVEEGGAVVALDSSAGYFIDLFKLPVKNVLEKTTRERFDCPGSMLRILVDPEHPLGFGMRREEAAYFAGSPAFQTRLPDARFERRVIARYPDDDRDILVSGYLQGGEMLEKRAAVVEFTVGEGRILLIGFRAQHRAQPHRTFKLLFNSLYQLERNTVTAQETLACDTAFGS
jgi:hypothetical protein